MKRRWTKYMLLIPSVFLGLILSPAMANASVYVGTQDGSSYYPTGLAAVYKYEGGTTWTNISAGTQLGQAVMALQVFDGRLYASAQTYAGYGGNTGSGRVWRYDGETTWTLVGTMGTSVMDLVVYRNQLYAVVTDTRSRNRGQLYRYEGAPGAWTLVGVDRHWHNTGFFTAIVSSVSGSDEIILGDLNTDKWSTYSPETGLVFRQDRGGSCVWDFGELDGTVYSGHWWGPIYQTRNARSWSWVTRATNRHLWAVKPFQGRLYVGGSGAYSYSTGRLDVLNGSSLQTVWEYSSSSWLDGITRLAPSPDDSLLYIGTGVRSGYYTGSGNGTVWTYDGTNVTRISPNNYFGGGVQALLATNTPPVANAGSDQTVSCSGSGGASVPLDGSGSSDADGDGLTYTWTGVFGTATGVNPTVQIPLGTYSITLTVDDGNGGTAQDTVVITVEDREPPATSAVVTGKSGSNGWYVSDVDVLLTSTDDCSGCLEVHYALDGSETVVPGSTASVTISSDGLHTLGYWGIDGAGNVEAAKTTEIWIDKTPPSLTVTVAPGLLWPPNHRMVLVTPSIHVSDNLTGSPTVELLSVVSNEPDDGLGDGDTANDIVINADGTVSLRAERSGAGTGRVYTFTYQATDLAGNVTTATATAACPHDMGRK